MRVFLTGATGFVGRWLARELAEHGHEIVGGERRIDVCDGAALRGALIVEVPDAIVHLAAVAYAPDVSADPIRGLQVNVGGTLNVVEAARLESPNAAVLIAGSSEVYGSPTQDLLPLTEDAPLAPSGPYGLSKAAAEGIAVAYASRFDLPLVVTRSFNHTGPGQRAEFVVPALAQRVINYAEKRSTCVEVGNLDVRRDFTDVRDVVRAYRLILEALATGNLPRRGAVLNVASGRSISIREIVAEFARLAGVDPPLHVEDRLVRPGEPGEIVGNAAPLKAATDWQPQILLARTLADVWHAIAAEPRSSVTATAASRCRDHD